MDYITGAYKLSQTIGNALDIGWAVRNLTSQISSIGGSNNTPTVTVSNPAKDKPELLDQRCTMIKGGIVLLSENSIIKKNEMDVTATKLLIGDHIVSVLFPAWNQSLKHYDVSVKNLTSLHWTVKNMIDQKSLNPTDETDRLYLVVGMEGFRALAKAYENKYNIRLKSGYKEESIKQYSKAAKKLKESADKIQEYILQHKQDITLQQFRDKKLQVINNILEENKPKEPEKKEGDHEQEKVEEQPIINEPVNKGIIFKMEGLFESKNHNLLTSVFKEGINLILDNKEISSSKEIETKKTELFNLAKTVDNYMKNIDGKFQVGLKNAGYW